MANITDKRWARAVVYALGAFWLCYGIVYLSTGNRAFLITLAVAVAALCGFIAWDIRRCERG